MASSSSPLFALLPPEVLAKARDLARKFETEDQLRDLADRRMFSLAGLIVILVFAHLLIALGFLGVVTDFVRPASGWVKGIATLYGLAICLGGTALMFLAYVAWLEVVVFKRVAPLLNPKEEGLRFYRRSTWLSLIPFTAAPLLINAWFSVAFFLALVSIVLVGVVVAFVYADASR